MAEETGEKDSGCDVCRIKCWTNEGLVGSKEYPYGYMCTPTLPWRKGGVAPPFFFGKDEKLPLLLSLFLGLQHCLAMLIGIATSGGFLIANDACLSWQFDSEMCELKPWLISTAWISCGILTIVQVFRAKIRGTPYYLGTGLISVMGTSFTFLPIVREMVIDSIMDARDNAPCEVDASGDPIWTGTCCHNGDCKGAGAQGYGDFLGTVLVASLIEVGIAFIPPHIMKKLFPPVVTGATVMMIGAGLLVSGAKYVGGGVFCAENTESRAAAGVSVELDPTVWGFGPDPYFTGLQDKTIHGNIFLRNTAAGNAFGTIGPQLCGNFGTDANDNGEVVLGFGDSAYVGLAFSVIAFATLLQIFGSPFFKSTFLFWGLCFGCAMAAIGYDHDGKTYSFYRKDYIDNIDDLKSPITFLWVERTFPIGFSAENLLPILIGFIVSSAETIGDVTMSCEYSKVTDPDEIASRIQGGVLADGINSFLSALFGSPPNTTFSQNNGLIALTRCASRSAGFSCAFWLILFGVVAPIGAAFASIPICVIGGVVLLAWGSVFVSGLSLATRDFSRRNQYILTVACSIGLAVAMEGQGISYPGPLSFYRRVLAYDQGFWPMKHVCKTPIPGGEDFCPNYNGPCCAEWDDDKKMGRSTVLKVIAQPYAICFFFVFILNLVMPYDDEELADAHEKKSGEKADA